MLREELEINPWPSLDTSRPPKARPEGGKSRYPQSATVEERLKTAPKFAKWFVTTRLKIAPNDMRYDQAFSDAMLGLLQAAQQHNPEIGVWSTFAVLCMEHMCNRTKAYWRTRMRTCPGELVDVDAFVEADEPDTRVRDTIADDRGTPHEALVRRRLSVDLRVILASLDTRSERALRMRVGLRNGPRYGVDCTLDEVGLLRRQSRERVRQIEAKALRVIRHPNRSTAIRPYVA